MTRYLNFALALLFGGLTLFAQTASRIPTNEPFRLESGSSFSASSGKTTAEPAPAASTASAATLVSDFQYVLDTIRRHHVDGAKLDHNAMTKSSINSMLRTLDPHSSYFDAAEFRQLLGEQDGEYFGTGSTITNYIKDGRFGTYVVATQANTAASRAELRYGDRILAVDGMSVDGAAVEVVRDKVRGRRGTTVRITIERAVDGKIETIEMRRDRVAQPSIPDAFMVRDGVGYIALSEGFAHQTANELDSAFAELRRRGMTSLILDLRGNTGGILDQAVKVADKFLPSGTPIISQLGRYPFDNRTWRSANRHPEQIPLVVVVDQDTASASEVVAGALQDNDRALIVGQTTFGKGLVQNVVELPMGSGLTLTTARYYTPSGRSIQRDYSRIGRYDYFNGRSTAAVTVAEPRPQTRTTTNRRMFGGAGITPDERVEAETFDPKKGALLDPVFFFVREALNQHKGNTENSSPSLREKIRQSIIFDKDPLTDDLLAMFHSYARSAEWNVPSSTLDSEAPFITAQLRYQLALATFGPEAATRVRIRSDKAIESAIAALPRSAALAEAARRVRLSTEVKKTRRVAFPTGQGRNRRN